MLPTITPDTLEIPPGHEVVLRGQTWEDYESLIEQYPERPALKISYSASRQEIRIMSPLAGHAFRSQILANLVIALLRHQGRDWHGFDTVTLKRFRQQGIEPDACFYIENWQAVLGRERIDLEDVPPPDLVIEVGVTSLTQPEDYVFLRVPELWIYRAPRLQIYRWQDQGYRLSEESGIFPGFPVTEVIPQFVERAGQGGSSVALREFEVYLQSFVC